MPETDSVVHAQDLVHGGRDPRSGTSICSDAEELEAGLGFGANIPVSPPPFMLLHPGCCSGACGERTQAHAHGLVPAAPPALLVGAKPVLV